MKRGKIYFMLLFLFLSASCLAQKMPERGLVRKGNRQYNKEKYDRAVDTYLEALKVAHGNFEASFDLASALMRTERYERAEQILTKLLADSTRTELERSEVAYNLGDVQFAQQKLKESLASFKKAMRLNPDDQEAKYNYAYVKKMMEEQQNQDQQNQDNKQNQDQNKDQQDNKQDQNKDNQDNKQNQDQNQDQNSDQDKKDNQDQNQDQKQDSGMSQKEQEAMLEAIQAQEDKTQEKLKEKKGVLIRKAKNW